MTNNSKHICYFTQRMAFYDRHCHLKWKVLREWVDGYWSNSELYSIQLPTMIYITAPR